MFVPREFSAPLIPQVSRPVGHRREQTSSARAGAKAAATPAARDRKPIEEPQDQVAPDAWQGGTPEGSAEAAGGHAGGRSEAAAALGETPPDPHSGGGESAETEDGVTTPTSLKDAPPGSLLSRTV
ncbi:MAG: hypothetical protein Kow0032_22150 [Methyloligellaceae bacterium]